MAIKHVADDGTWRHQFQVYIQWASSDEWQRVGCFASVTDAREFARDNISTTGGRVKRTEVRERGAVSGEAIYDKGWRWKDTTP